MRFFRVLLVCGAALAGLGLLLAPLWARAIDDQATFHTSIINAVTDQAANVTALVTVTDANHAPIFNLEASNFTVKIDDQSIATRTIKLANTDNFRPLNLVLAVDKSILADPDNKKWTQMRAIAVMVQQALRAEDRLSLIFFSSDVVSAPQVSLAGFAELWEKQQPDQSYTALHRALLAAKNLVANPKGRTAIIVITDHSDNTAGVRNLPPPPTMEQLITEFTAPNNNSMAPMYIYCYGPPNNSAAGQKYIEDLKKIATKEGKVETPPDLPTLQQALGRELSKLQPKATYQLNFQAPQLRVNKPSTLTIATTFMQQTVYENFSPLVLDGSTIIVAIANPNEKILLPSNTTEFTRAIAITPAPGIALQSVQVALNQKTPALYPATARQIHLKNLTSGAQYTITATVEDRVGNINQSDPFILSIAQPLTIEYLSPTTIPLTQTYSSVPAPVFTLTATSGAFPIRVTAAYTSEAPSDEQTTTQTKVITLTSPHTPYSLTMAAESFVKPLPPPRFESLTECLPHAPALSPIATAFRQLRQTPTITSTFQTKLAAFTQASTYISNLRTNATCMLAKERALGQAIWVQPIQRKPSIHLIRVSARDSVNLPVLLDDLRIPINFAVPSRWERVQPYRSILLADLIVLCLLLLLGWWLRRRYLAAHLAHYQILIRNEGNLACRYWLRAEQTNQPALARPKVLPTLPTALEFKFLVGNEELRKLEPGRATPLGLLKATKSGDATNPQSAIPPIIQSTAQQVGQIDPRNQTLDLHQRLGTLTANAYAITLGETGWVETTTLAPEEAPFAEPLQIELRIRVRKRHWRRRNYTFVLYSQPAGQREVQPRSTLETVRFGGLFAPKRIDKPVRAPAVADRSPASNQRAVAPG